MNFSSADRVQATALQLTTSTAGASDRPPATIDAQQPAPAHRSKNSPERGQQTAGILNRSQSVPNLEAGPPLLPILLFPLHQQGAVLSPFRLLPDVLQGTLVPTLPQQKHAQRQHQGAFAAAVPARRKSQQWHVT